MPKTTVDVDPKLLAAAKARLGTSTIKDTINAALREVAEQGEREEAIDEVAAMVRGGDLDWNVLDEKQKYRATPAGVASEDTSCSVEGAQVEGSVDLAYEVASEFGNRDFGLVEFKSVSRAPERVGPVPAKLRWHTPASLVTEFDRHLALVSAALENLPSPEVLSAARNLQISDPTMGSGAFLRAAMDLATHRVTDKDIRAMRAAIQRLQIQYSPLGAHPDDETKGTLKSVDAVLQDLEALAGALDVDDEAAE
ncbi:hypothetical protein [Streptomyces sp. NPDC001604]|uniref:hypothetical protein n=1 Tax=Streptomyces sp. NPDC001604 TaxID=3364593 RepID=UPI0036B482A2